MTVYYAEIDYPEIVEREMLKYFMDNVSEQSLNNLRDKSLPLPFANLRYIPGRDKRHGLKHQTKN